MAVFLTVLLVVFALVDLVVLVVLVDFLADLVHFFAGFLALTTFLVGFFALEAFLTGLVFLMALDLEDLVAGFLGDFVLDATLLATRCKLVTTEKLWHNAFEIPWGNRRCLGEGESQDCSTSLSEWRVLKKMLTHCN